MKTKYKGIVSIGLVLLAIVLVGGYSVMAGRSVETQPDRPSHSDMPKLSVPSEQEIQRMQRLTPALPRLALPGIKPVTGRPLTLFGFSDGEIADDKTYADGKELQPMDYRLTLTLMAGNQHYCIIDGEFVAEGGKLEDGALIVRVENQRVLIRKQDDEKWVYIEDAGQPSEISQSNYAKEKGPS